MTRAYRNIPKQGGNITNVVLWQMETVFTRMSLVTTVEETSLRGWQLDVPKTMRIWYHPVRNEEVESASKKFELAEQRLVLAL